MLVNPALAAVYSIRPKPWPRADMAARVMVRAHFAARSNGSAARASGVH
jgi:hypothetical protein